MSVERKHLRGPVSITTSQTYFPYLANSGFEARKGLAKHSSFQNQTTFNYSKEVVIDENNFCPVSSFYVHQQTNLEHSYLGARPFEFNRLYLCMGIQDCSRKLSCFWNQIQTSAMGACARKLSAGVCSRKPFEADPDFLLRRNSQTQIRALKLYVWVVVFFWSLCFPHENLHFTTESEHTAIYRKPDCCLLWFSCKRRIFPEKAQWQGKGKNTQAQSFKNLDLCLKAQREAWTSL